MAEIINHIIDESQIRNMLYGRSEGFAQMFDVSVQFNSQRFSNAAKQCWFFIKNNAFSVVHFSMQVQHIEQNCFRWTISIAKQHCSAAWRNGEAILRRIPDSNEHREKNRAADFRTKTLTFAPGICGGGATGDGPTGDGPEADGDGPLLLLLVIGPVGDPLLLVFLSNTELIKSSKVC